MANILFFDTSALVKYFYLETGSEHVTDLIDDPENTVQISTLAHLEFVSALHRKHREGALEEANLNRALKGFEQVINTFKVYPLDEPIFERAIRVVRKHGNTHALRTLDALHLATHLHHISAKSDFVVSDHRLAEVARLEGLSVINPSDSSKSQSVIV